MKKKVKIVAVVLLVVLAIGCLILPISEIIEQVKWLDGLKESVQEGFIREEMYEDELKSRIKDLFVFLYPYFVLIILLALNAFLIIYDFSFQDSIRNFKSKCLEKQKQAKQKKYDKLKSEIEKMESDK